MPSNRIRFPTSSEAREASELSRARLDENRALRAAREAQRRAEATKRLQKKLRESRIRANEKRKATLRRVEICELLIKEGLDGRNFADLANLNNSDIDFLRGLGARVDLIFDKVSYLAAQDLKLNLEREHSELLCQIASLRRLMINSHEMSGADWRELWRRSGMTRDLPVQHCSIDPAIAWWRIKNAPYGMSLEWLNAVNRFREWVEERRRQGDQRRPEREKLEKKKDLVQQKINDLNNNLEKVSHQFEDDRVYRVFFGRGTSFGKVSNIDSPIDPKWIRWIVESAIGKNFSRRLASKILQTSKHGGKRFVLPVRTSITSRGTSYDYQFSTRATYKGPATDFFPNVLKACGFKIKTLKHGDVHTFEVCF